MSPGTEVAPTQRALRPLPQANSVGIAVPPAPSPKPKSLRRTAKRYVSRERHVHLSRHGDISGVRILMLLGNGYEPDPRVQAEARALVRGGAEVEVLAWDRDGDLPLRAEADGVRVERIRLLSTHGRGPGQVPYMLAFWGRVTKLALRRSFDLVWCHDLDTLPVGYAVTRLRRASLLFDAHESYPDMVRDSVGPALTGLLRRVERRLVRKADAIVTVGNRLADHYSDMGARRVVVAGNWKRPGDFALPAGRRQEIRDSLGIPRNAYVVSNIGWLSHERQLEPLLSAIRSARDLWLLLGGRGPMEERCREAARDCPRIRYVGWVPSERIPALTAAADSVYYGFDAANGNARFSAPNKLFEAISAGIPVVTGAFGEIEEIVRREGLGTVLREYAPREIVRGVRCVMDRERFLPALANARRQYTRDRADRAIRKIVRELVPRPGAGRFVPDRLQMMEA